jgi:hypothetical protein
MGMSRLSRGSWRIWDHPGGSRGLAEPANTDGSARQTVAAGLSRDQGAHG